MIPTVIGDMRDAASVSARPVGMLSSGKVRKRRFSDDIKPIVVVERDDGRR